MDVIYWTQDQHLASQELLRNSCCRCGRLLAFVDIIYWTQDQTGKGDAYDQKNQGNTKRQGTVSVLYLHRDSSYHNCIGSGNAV